MKKLLIVGCSLLVLSGCQASLASPRQDVAARPSAAEASPPLESVSKTRARSSAPPTVAKPDEAEPAARVASTDLTELGWTLPTAVVGETEMGLESETLSAKPTLPTLRVHACTWATGSRLLLVFSSKGRVQWAKLVPINERGGVQSDCPYPAAGGKLYTAFLTASSPDIAGVNELLQKKPLAGRALTSRVQNWRAETTGAEMTARVTKTNVGAHDSSGVDVPPPDDPNRAEEGSGSHSETKAKTNRPAAPTFREHLRWKDKATKTRFSDSLHGVAIFEVPALPPK